MIELFAFGLAVSVTANLYLAFVAIPETRRVADFWRAAYHRQTNLDAKSAEDARNAPADVQGTH